MIPRAGAACIVTCARFHALHQVVGCHSPSFVFAISDGRGRVLPTQAWADFRCARKVSQFKVKTLIDRVRDGDRQH
ncbi:hypothetical protein XAP6164_4810016 [Xanthomonas phaseoli pv. phaseoli]|nr:hypothetical protein XAP6164_4810016 [Xanthomonas phaseoli pv. phaseoli]